jgi:hypothetical protein
MLKPGKLALKLTKSDSRAGSELDDRDKLFAILQSDYNSKTPVSLRSANLMKSLCRR